GGEFATDEWKRGNGAVEGTCGDVRDVCIVEA
ncbi:hypothetical protein A2U01_0083878, partial [Trifolium medium]|nr:hypothetical protein [Trifolium medium]